MEGNANNKSSNRNDANRRPAFTLADWIIAAFSIALMVFILLNIPAY